jgi:diaminopropionate ammonia-lyase
MTYQEFYIDNQFIRAVANKPLRKSFSPDKIVKSFSPTIAESVLKYHRSFPEYHNTPLVSLDNLAARLNIKHLLVKDESTRFGLNAFKVLGGTYAIGKILERKSGFDFGQVNYDLLKSENVLRKTGRLTFATASDGNHGRGVAWAATQLGHQAVIFLPRDTVRSRIEAIKQTGAEVIITETDYDQTVLQAKETAYNNNWILVQDTAFENYTEIPLWIMQGYLTLISEIIMQMREISIKRPTHIFLQAGVGSMAAAALAYLVNVYRDKYPTTLIIEPHQAACFYRSVKIGDTLPHPADGNLKTMMAGLSCGVPSTIAWDIIKNYADFMISCPDDIAAEGMRLLARPFGDDKKIISGESGAVGVGLIAEIMQNNLYNDLRTILNLNSESIVLLINTEGATDPENYRRIVG